MQVGDGETSPETKTEEGCFQKAHPCSGERIIDYGPSCKHRNSSAPLWVQL